MQSSYPFDMYSGIFEPKHYERIGSALWLFIWCISSTTREELEDGVTWGLVLGNKPVKLAELAIPFGVDEKTVSRWIKVLVHHDYLKSIRTHHGLILKIKNSKKFIKKSDKYVQFPNVKTDNNVRSLSEKADNNVRCNKDIIKILIDRLIDDLDDERLVTWCGVLTTVIPKEIHLDPDSVKRRFVEIEQYFNQRKRRLQSAASDWPAMQKFAEAKIPLEFILFGIDLAFARKEKTKQWATDTIGNFAYCGLVIEQSWNKLIAEIKQIETEALPERSPKRNPPPGGSKSNRQQRQLSLLEQLAEEEKQIEQSGSKRAAQAN